MFFTYYCDIYAGFCMAFYTGNFLDVIYITYLKCRVMEIPSLASCQRMQYENELLRKKVLKLRNERDSLKVKLEIAEKKIAESQERASADVAGATRKHPSPTLLTSSDSIETIDEYTDKKLISLAKGEEPRPRKIITEEGKRLHGLIDMQNKVIQRYEAQLKELKKENSSCEELRKENEAMKLENEFIKRQMEESKAGPQDITSQERIELLLRELSAVKREKDELYNGSKRMKEELSCLDPEFFEEIEDLKFSLIQTRRLNKEYEKTIQVLSHKLGISPPVERKSSS